MAADSCLWNARTPCVSLIKKNPCLIRVHPWPGFPYESAALLFLHHAATARRAADGTARQFSSQLDSDAARVDSRYRSCDSRRERLPRGTARTAFWFVALREIFRNESRR